MKQIVDFTDRRGLLDNTAVIVTADHGEAFGEDGFMTHSLKNRGNRQALQHVPLIIIVPDGSRARVDTLVTNADIAPTVYELAGIDWTPVAQESFIGNFGRSLAPYLGMSTMFGDVAESRTAIPTDGEIDSSRRRAINRLRALGYIK